MDNYSDVPYDVDFGILDRIIDFLASAGMMLFGLIAFFISFYMTLITTFDLIYINFPAFQLLARKRNLDGSEDIKKLKLRVISRDAYRSVLEKETSNTYKNVNLIYFRKRLGTYIRLAMILSFLILGPRLVIPLANKILRPLFEAFNLIK